MEDLGEVPSYAKLIVREVEQMAEVHLGSTSTVSLEVGRRCQKRVIIHQDGLGSFVRKRKTPSSSKHGRSSRSFLIGPYKILLVAWSLPASSSGTGQVAITGGQVAHHNMLRKGQGEDLMHCGTAAYITCVISLSRSPSDSPNSSTPLLTSRYKLCPLKYPSLPPFPSPRAVIRYRGPSL